MSQAFRELLKKIGSGVHTSKDLSPRRSQGRNLDDAAPRGNAGADWGISDCAPD